MKTLSRLFPLTLLVLFATVALLLPFFTFAQTSNPGQLTGVSTFLGNIVNFMNNTLVPVIFALAFLVFLWGMFTTFILGGHDEEKQSAGKSMMLYSIIGFVVMVSLWGIVNLLANGFGFGGAQLDNTPTIKVPAPRN